tara:strand:- start:134 stop:418 length:285 start_codon:yes stop_codon:yes gene_type:complete
MKNQYKNIEEVFKLLSNLHLAADEYEKSGLKPVDLIRSTDALKEIDVHEAFGIEKYDFEAMSWGEACHFILTYSDYYSDELKKFRAPPQSKLLH